MGRRAASVRHPALSRAYRSRAGSPCEDGGKDARRALPRASPVPRGATICRARGHDRQWHRGAVRNPRCQAQCTAAAPGPTGHGRRPIERWRSAGGDRKATAQFPAILQPHTGKPTAPLLSRLTNRAVKMALIATFIGLHTPSPRRLSTTVRLRTHTCDRALLTGTCVTTRSTVVGALSQS